MRKSLFPEFNPVHWHFLVRWAATVLTASIHGQNTSGAKCNSLQLPHPLQYEQTYKDLTKTYRCPLPVRQVFPERGNKLYSTAMNPYFICLLWLDISTLTNHYTFISPSPSPSEVNPTVIYSYWGYCLFTIFPSRSDEKTPGKMDETLNLSRANAVLT